MVISWEDTKVAFSSSSFAYFYADWRKHAVFEIKMSGRGFSVVNRASASLLSVFDAFWIRGLIRWAATMGFHKSPDKNIPGASLRYTRTCCRLNWRPFDNVMQKFCSPIIGSVRWMVTRRPMSREKCKAVLGPKISIFKQVGKNLECWKISGKILRCQQKIKSVCMNLLGIGNARKISKSFKVQETNWKKTVLRYWEKNHKNISNIARKRSWMLENFGMTGKNTKVGKTSKKKKSSVLKNFSENSKISAENPEYQGKFLER